MTLGTWLALDGVEDVRDGAPIEATAGARSFALFRCGEALYATESECSHEQASLAEGFQDGCVIECPLHGAQFDLRTGDVITGPADEPVTTFAARIEGGRVEVLVPDSDG